ncbi:MAG: DUF2608 domain-containing protein [Planctomycetota bacterium]
MTPALQPLLAVAAGVAALSAAARVSASEYRETIDFGDAAESMAGYVDRFGADDCLFVVDIDNTLMAMRGDLGSDAWFEWQEYLQKHEPDSPHLVAAAFPQLLDIQGILFTLGSMRPTQPDLPKLVRRIQGAGVPTLVLTSRGPIYRAATIRELEANGYHFADTVIETTGLPAGEFLPYDPDNLAAKGFSAREGELFRLRAPRPVSFGDGVFMGAGQHKGAMLLGVLHHARRQPKAVVFIDDHGRHVHRVYDALSRRGIECTVFHYKRENDNVARFRYSDKAAVTEQWKRLQSGIEEAFPGQKAPAAAADGAPRAAHGGTTAPAAH